MGIVLTQGTTPDNQSSSEIFISRFIIADNFFYFYFYRTCSQFLSQVYAYKHNLVTVDAY